MKSKIIFSWAQNENGEIVHIKDVPNGIRCNCICPHCKEKLLARHGNIRQNGFAHRSNERKANLEICYQVILYKLAEQIIQKNKQIYAPSYYGIYKEGPIKFIDVKIDSRYEREDKQPDVIATTKDNQEYLIEFIFKEKVSHNKSYNNLSCMEIDLANQTLESLEEFLLSSSKDRIWKNNEIYFNGIEEKYKKANKPIILKNESDCNLCKLKRNCCAVIDPSNSGYPILIKHNGNTYRLCKKEDFDKISEQHNTKEQKRHTIIHSNDSYIKEVKPQKIIHSQESYNSKYSPTPIANKIPIQDRSCFNCCNNLKWANKNGLARCGIYESLHISPMNRPEIALKCNGFKQ